MGHGHAHAAAEAPRRPVDDGRGNPAGLWLGWRPGRAVYRFTKRQWLRKCGRSADHDAALSCSGFAHLVIADSSISAFSNRLRTRPSCSSIAWRCCLKSFCEFFKLSRRAARGLGKGRVGEVIDVGDAGFLFFAPIWMSSSAAIRSNSPIIRSSWPSWRRLSLTWNFFSRTRFSRDFITRYSRTHTRRDTAGRTLTGRRLAGAVTGDTLS